MKWYLFFILSIFLMFSGCVRHYYRVNDHSVDLYLEKPGARQVFLIASFDGFKPHRAKKIDRNTWEVTVPANAEFKYFYEVDGSYYLPPCSNKENDDFGTQNCIYIPQM